MTFVTISSFIISDFAPSNSTLTIFLYGVRVGTSSVCLDSSCTASWLTGTRRELNTKTIQCTQSGGGSL